MFEQILVAYAGDRAGRDAVLLTSRLSALSGGRVTVVIPYHPLFAEVSGEVALQRAREELEVMHGTGTLAERARFRWSNASWPIRTLHELAEYEGADLIVFGAAPERLGRRHVDLMERMVHGAPCAVAVAPDGYAEREEPALMRVGAGFADTPEGRAAVATAAELADAAGGQLRIIAGTGLSGALASYAAMSPALPGVEEELYEETGAALERIAGELDTTRRPAVELHRGDPVRVLEEASGELDLLVLGSRGYGPVRRALLGSVSAELMRRSRCPVLVLPRGHAHAESPTLSATAQAEG